MAMLWQLERVEVGVACFEGCGKMACPGSRADSTWAGRGNIMDSPTMITEVIALHSLSDVMAGAGLSGGYSALPM
jgi:hypothetical protein